MKPTTYLFVCHIHLNANFKLKHLLEVYICNDVTISYMLKNIDIYETYVSAGCTLLNANFKSKRLFKANKEYKYSIQILLNDIVTKTT